MKMRIKGDSIRLRLTQSETVKLAADGLVEDSIAFGSVADERLFYAIRTADDTDQTTGSFRSNRIEIAIPVMTAREWLETDRVSIKATKRLDSAGELAILIEKDFACLKPRPGDDDGDTFTNPRAAETC